MTREEIDAFIALVLVMGSCMAAAALLIWLLSQVGVLRWM